MSYRKRPSYESEQSPNDFRLKKLKMLKVQHTCYTNHETSINAATINKSSSATSPLSQEILENNTAEILLSLKLSQASPSHVTTIDNSNLGRTSQPSMISAVAIPASLPLESSSLPSTTHLNYNLSPVENIYFNEEGDDEDDDKPLDLRTTNGVQQGLTEERLIKLLKENNVIDIIKHKKCMVCGINFSGLLELAKHHCEKLTQREFNCPKCKKPYRTNANLHSHLRWCGKSSVKRLNKKKNLSISSSPSTSSTSSHYSHNARLPSPGMDLASVSPSYIII